MDVWSYTAPHMSPSDTNVREQSINYVGPPSARFPQSFEKQKVQGTVPPQGRTVRHILKLSSTFLRRVVEPYPFNGIYPLARPPSHVYFVS